MKIAIIGIGGIGGLISALLSRKGYEVIAISSNKSAKAINQKGLLVSSSNYGNFRQFVEAKPVLDVPVDYIFFTTKYPYLLASFDRIEEKKIGDPAFVSLLNGLGSREKIIEHFGSKFLNGSIGSIEVFRDGNGKICQPQKQRAHIDLSKEKEVEEIIMERLVKVISSLDISVTTYPSHDEVIWKKLVRLGAIASATAAYQKPIGEIRDNEDSRNVLIGLVEEGVEVAKSIGIKIKGSQTIKDIDRLPHNLNTSLARDLRQSKPSEIEAITLAIVTKAKENSINARHYKSILRIIKEKYNVAKS